MPEEHNPDYVWVPDPDWRVRSDQLAQCRMLSGEKHGRCPNTAVAELNRGRYTRMVKKAAWWPYCSEHLYGRKIENGVVLVQVHYKSDLAKNYAREIEARAAKR